MLRALILLMVLVLGAVTPQLSRAAAPEGEVQALQQALGALGYFKGPANGEMSDELKAAIARYTQDAGLKGSPERWTHQPGALARDAELEKRIRLKKTTETARLTIPTRFGDVAIVTYRQKNSPPGFADGRRATFRGERFAAPLTGFATCCEHRILSVKDTDFIVLQGGSDQRDCPFTRIYIAVEAQRITASEGDRSCAVQVALDQDGERLSVRARSAAHLLDERYTMRPGGLLAFRGLSIPGSLEPLLRFAGHQPWENVDGHERFFLFPPLTAALAAILEPEAIGWTLKLSQTQPVERRGPLLFARGTFGQDETAVAIVVDTEREAVHACIQGPEATRMSSTMLRGVYVDPNASCSTTMEEAMTRWSSLGLIQPAVDAPVFGFEGEYGEEPMCKDRNATVKLGSRRLRDPYGDACFLYEVGFAEGRYQLKTSCGLLNVKKLDEDRLEIDGEPYQRCPQTP